MIQIKMLVVQLMVASLFFNMVMSSGSGRHSLWGLASYISGGTQFPEFSAVIMLDDIQVGYYDSEADSLRRVRGGDEEVMTADLVRDALFMLRELSFDLKNRLMLVKHRFNATAAGVYVQQRLGGCEVLDDGQPAFIMFRDASNGQDADSLMYNMTHFTYAGAEGWEYRWDTMTRIHVETLTSNLFLPYCVRAFKHLLDRNKRLVTRRVRPQVHFITKQVVGGTRVTCLATDFYPRHINLTLLRDGQPVDDDELIGGSVLPNCNGLYQVRKTLMVGDEELQRKHNYTCEASHLSLDNRLEVRWRADFSRSYRAPIISAPVGLMIAVVLLIAVILLVVLLWWWRRRRRREGVAMEAQEQPGETELRHLQQEEESRRDDVFLEANQEVSVTLIPST